MMAQYGWKSKPSPRRGFTVVEASREVARSPVVVAVRGSLQALRLFRSALDEAMTRSLDLIVLDYGVTTLRDELKDETRNVDPRERSAMRALWANPHVSVLRMNQTEVDLENTVSYCETVKASLLILGADQIGSTALAPSLTNRIFNGDFDVLVVTDHPTRDRMETEQLDHGG